MGGVADPRCTDVRLGEALTAYSFGELTETGQKDVESHLLECDACWEEFRRLEVSVRVLRVEEQAQPSFTPQDVVSQLGLSSRLERPFGGHRAYVLAVAVLYGLEWMIGLWSELGYSYQRFGTLAWALSAPVVVWAAGCLLVGLRADTRAVQAGRPTGLTQSATFVLSGLAVLTAGLMAILPAERTILASFETRTASAGYFKDALLIFLPLLVFVVPPFHAILALQRELRLGRHQQILKLVARSPESITPRGVWYLSPRVLVGVLFVLGILKILGTNNMLDALTPGPYGNLFSVAAYISTAVWFTIPVVCLVWYSTNLNELKREALALQTTSRAPRPSGMPPS